MDNKTTPPLSVVITPSLRQQYFQLTTHLLAIGAVLFCPLPLAYKTALCFAIAFSYGFGHFTTGYRSSLALHYRQDKGWHLTHNGLNHRIKIESNPIISTQALILYLEFLEKDTTLSGIARKIGLTPPMPLFIPADSLSPEEYRQLVVTVKLTWRNSVPNT